MLRAYTVFHASQIDGILPVVSPTPLDVSWRRPEAVDTIVANSGAVVRVGGGQAFYSTGSDHIQMPPHAAFGSPEGFAATMLHELGHWTGAKHRLARDMTGRFGSASYAAEEPRVEIASALMCTELGLPCKIPNHASSLRSWLGKLREDKREIFRAAAAAQRIADYCLGFHPFYRDNNIEATADDDALHDARMAGLVLPG